MNGASGTSDIEGQAATGSGKQGRSRASFNSSDRSNGPASDSGNPNNLVNPVSKRVNQELRNAGKDFLFRSDSFVPTFLIQNLNHGLHGYRR